MTASRVYFDYNASAPLLPAAREAMVAALMQTGNASSVHHEGRAVRKTVEQARQILANAMDVPAKQVTFTSGATEAAALALSPTIRFSGQPMAISRLYVSAVEHPCVLNGGRFARDAVTVLPVDSDGVIDLQALDQALAAHDRDTGTAMVAVMAANNETGVVQPIADVSRIVRTHGAFLTVDAVQVLGKANRSFNAADADFILLSAHKIGGPQGVGALVCGNALVQPVPLLAGGGQEAFIRPGTENSAAIAGFGAAVAALPDETELKRITAIRDSIEAGIRTISTQTGLNLSIFGEGAPRLGNTTCFAFAGVKAETALIALDLAGMAVSSGSACSSGKVRASHVLTAMGIDAGTASGALRVSVGPGSKASEAERFLAEMNRIAVRSAGIARAA